VVYLEIDNSLCVLDQQDCFTTASQAAAFLGAAARNHRLNLGFNVYEAFSDAFQDGDDSITSGKDDGAASRDAVVAVLLALVAVAVVVLLGVMFRSRKRIRSAVTWFPDGFFKDTHP
jgi:Notch-like protein